MTWAPQGLKGVRENCCRWLLPSPLDDIDPTKDRVDRDRSAARCCRRNVKNNGELPSDTWPASAMSDNQNEEIPEQQQHRHRGMRSLRSGSAGKRNRGNTKKAVEARLHKIWTENEGREEQPSVAPAPEPRNP